MKLMIMYGFCRITDLGISRFYFSSKNCSSKVYIYIFKESCSSYYTEHSKIEFAIFGFSYDFILNLQVSAQTQKGGRFFLHIGTRKDLDFTTQPSNLTARPSNPRIPHRGTLGSGGGSPPTMWARLR
jgi:hypothetical protein